MYAGFEGITDTKTNGPQDLDSSCCGKRKWKIDAACNLAGNYWTGIAAALKLTSNH